MSPSEEKAFTTQFKDLNARKVKLNAQLNESVQNVSSLKSEKEIKEFLSSYRKTLDQIHGLGKDELDGVVKILGTKRAAQYLQIKLDLSNKVKSLITQPQSPKESGDKKLPPPKIIIE